MKQSYSSLFCILLSLGIVSGCNETNNGSPVPDNPLIDGEGNDNSEEDIAYSRKGTNCHPSTLFGWNYCRSWCLCDVGQGDCDSDSECKPGLKCVPNVGQ